VGRGAQGQRQSRRIDDDFAADLAEALQALAAPSRLRILAELSERPRSVGELAAAVEMEQSAVSHQLRLLRQAGLVVRERQGKRSIYALQDSHVSVLLAEATYHVEHLRLGQSRPAWRS
jgi:DNA-binding transcriptional ArsR family regulator